VCRLRADVKHPHQEFMQIDTTNILFICGGAFDGLEKIIQNRIGKKGIGFGAELSGKRNENIGDILRHVLPQDLIRFGLIPEFVGRVPVVATLDALDKEALIRILTEPRNALTKQYQKLFEMDGVTLEFKDGTLEIIAEEAIRRNTGARGLRAILEGILLDVMYELPAGMTSASVIIKRDVIQKRDKPILVTADKRKKKKEESA
jgi:ATP-dependent Clp protease ATP-binding subunit ClpX